MFIAIRMVNGVVALLALVLAAYVFSWAPQSVALQETGVRLSVVVLFFIADLTFRKKNQFSDKFFAATWTLFFSWLFFLGIQKLWLGDISEGEGGTMYFSVVVSIFTAVPLLLNSTYLFASFFTEKE